MQDIFREFIVYARGCVLRNKKRCTNHCLCFQNHHSKNKTKQTNKSKTTFQLTEEARMFSANPRTNAKVESSWGDMRVPGDYGNAGG